jgi:hypothetical protein
MRVLTTTHADVDAVDKARIGSTSVTFGERLAYFDKIRALKRLRPGLFVHALVVHPGRPDRDRPRSDRHAPLPRVAVADDPPLTVLADLLGER